MIPLLLTILLVLVICAASVALCRYMGWSREIQALIVLTIVILALVFYLGGYI